MKRNFYRFAFNESPQNEFNISKLIFIKKRILHYSKFKAKN